MFSVAFCAKIFIGDKPTLDNFFEQNVKIANFKFSKSLSE